MANTQNNNLIEMSSNELVRYNNKYKVISKYDDKKYESNEVELINPALANLEVKILDPVKDEDEITLTAVVENGDSNQTYNYKWFIYKEDGETELPYGLGSDTSIAHIEDLDELEQFCLVSVAAYTEQGLFVGISDIKTVYRDTEDLTSPVRMDLSNDNTTIPFDLVNSNTSVDKNLFTELTSTYLTVLRGDNDITSSCDITWTPSSNDISIAVSNNSRQMQVVAMPATLKAGTVTVTVKYAKEFGAEGENSLTATYKIMRASEGAILYSLYLSQKVINTTYKSPSNSQTYSYKVKKCVGRTTTLLNNTQLQEEGLEVAWGYAEQQDLELEDYTLTPADGDFEYTIEGHTGLHIVLRSKDESNILEHYDSEIIPFVRDGGVFTDLILSANSPSFNVDANGNFAQNTVELTASLYGELEGKEAGIAWTWSIGKDLPSGTVSADRKTFTLTKANMADNNAIKVTATIKLNGEDYYDTMTIYKLKEGSSAITAFLTNQCINFSANADGIVNADNNNTHISKVRVFRGSEDISNLVSGVEIPSIKPQGMDIAIESITENGKQFKQIKIGITEGIAVNLGGTGSCDGELEFNITLTGSEAKIPLTLSWSKNNAGKDGAAGLNGTSPYTIQLDNDSDIIVKSSNGDWFVNDNEMAIVVNAACYKGDQKDDTVTSNDCQCDPPSTNWSGCYSWNGKVLRITKVPDSYNFTSGYFTFRWIKSGVTLATKNFSLSTTIAPADYDLIIPQVVYNIDTVGDNETFAIGVLKKGKDKIETLTSPGSEKIKIFGPGGIEVGDWGRVPVPRTAGEYTYTLKSTTESNLIWDEEVLTTVSNGEQGPIGPQGPQGGQGPQGTSPYLIELTNDSATIGTDKDGKGIDLDALRAATETTVQVWLGSDDITDECTFEWTPSGCTLSATTGNTVYLTAIDDDINTATATVEATVTADNTPIGSKTLTVTKNKQGEKGANAVTYVLSVSPNSWNKTEIPEIVPSFTVTKYDGGTASNIDTGYTIKTEDKDYVTNTPITETTTFDLWVGTVKVDSETVTAVANGNDSTVEGPAGPSIESEVRVYKWSSTMPETGGDGWKTIDGVDSYDHNQKDSFLWTCYRQEWTDDRAPTYTTPIRMTDYEMGTLMASKEGISISEWCEKYERTLIDGSTIATGGLIAETIQSGDYTLGAGTESALNFTLVGDHYKVGLKSTNIPSEVLIPEKYNGKPVTELDVSSFAVGADIIKKLAIPAGITTNPFGLLTGYTKLEELHLPVHQIGYDGNGPYFGNWFGMEDYDGPGKTPDPLKNVYLLGRSDNNIIPYTYFDMDTGGTNANIYLTPTITALAANALGDKDVGPIYYYNEGQFTNTDIVNAGNTLTKTNKAYTYPSVAIEGFCITSKEDHPMIDSPNFRVAQDGTVYAKNGEFTGTVYATDGKIGSVEIENIPSVGNPNLLGSVNDAEHWDYGVDGKASGNSTEGFYVTNDTENFIKYLYYRPVVMETNTTYTLSFDMQCNYFGTGAVNPIDMYLLLGESTTHVIACNDGWSANGRDKPSLRPKTDKFETYTITFTTEDSYENKGYINNCVLRFDNNGRNGGNSDASAKKLVTLTIKNLKLEKGDKATPLNYFIQDNLSSDAYSWQFSPVNGMAMWKGQQTKNNKVFSVDENGLFVSGTIHAIDGGNIGGWDIAEVCPSNPKGLGLFKRFTNGEEQVTSGMAAVGAGDTVAFWAGSQGGTPWEAGSENCSFYVTQDGTAHCANLKASGGNIAEIGIREGGLAAGDWKLNRDGLAINGNTSSIQLGETTISSNGAAALIKTTGNFTLEDGKGAALILGPTTTSQTIYVDMQFDHARTSSDSFDVQVTLRESYSQTGDKMTLYWYCHADSDKAAQSGSITWDLYPGTLTYTKTKTACTRYMWANQWFGFSINSPEQAKEQALGRGIGIDLAWDTIFEPRGNILSVLGSSSQSITCKGNINPQMVNGSTQWCLGSSGTMWKEVRANNFYGDTSQSDERVKNSIELLPEKYEVFFDKMEPTRYKYNKGTSDRYHTGFVAQQLVKSLEESGLTTQDFAGVMLDHPGEAEECWHLRRDEFVALNTWQIQKLKARAKQAEETIELQDAYIKKLEERIEKLEQKLNN